MARDIIITPFKDSVAAGEEPKIEFKGKDAGPIVKVVDDDGNVLYKGTLGSLLNINDDITKPWVVNDISGLPLVDIDEDGTIIMGEPLFEQLKISSEGIRLKKVTKYLFTLATTITAAHAIDLSEAVYHKFDLVDTDVTITFTNPSASDYHEFYVDLTKDNNGTLRTITWPTVLAEGGTLPNTLTTALQRSVYKFYTIDGGATYVAEQKFSSLS